MIGLAAETNPDRITTAAIAEQMEVTQGALFRHFPNKAAIWQAVMVWVAERLMQRLAAGQLLAEMDPVDLDAKLKAQQAALRRAESEVTAAQAQVEDGVARWDYARAQVARYEELLRARTASEDPAESAAAIQRWKRPEEMRFLLATKGESVSVSPLETPKGLRNHLPQSRYRGMY